MSFKSVKKTDFTKQDFKEWSSLKQKLFEITGFIQISKSETDKFRQACPTSHQYNFHFLNFKNAETSLYRNEKLDLFEVVINNGLLKVTIDNETFLPISNLRAFFVCPMCTNEYSFDAVPARFLPRSTPLCRKCVKSLQTSCLDYRTTFENAMSKKYGEGIKCPIQSSEIREKMKQTMLMTYGHEYAMQSQELRQKHADCMLKKYGKENWFSGSDYHYENLIKKSPILIKRTKDSSKPERELVDSLLKLFPNDEQYTYKNKKFVIPDTVNKKCIILDYYNKTKNLVVEFYGDYWHANPEVYSQDFIFAGKQTFDVVSKRNEDNKKLIIDNLKCKFAIIWETDWNRNKEKMINLIIEMVNSNE